LAGPFATASEFCEWTGMAVPSDLSRLQALLESASALIRGETGQVLSKVTGDVLVVQPEFDAVFGRRNPPPRAIGDVIYLPERPVTAVTMTVQAVSFTAFAFTLDGVVYRTDGHWWDYPATITYDHGYAETSEAFRQVRAICIEAAARAFTLNERSASEAMGSTLMESAGYAPEVFLTEGERRSLPGLMVGIG
jgi:hypothetical protein